MGLMDRILARIDTKSRHHVAGATSLTIDRRTEKLLIADLGGSTIMKNGKVSNDQIKTVEGCLVCGLRVSVIDTEDECFIVK